MKITMPVNNSRIPPPEVNEVDPFPKDAFIDPKGEKGFMFTSAYGGDDQSPTLKERYDVFMNETSFTALTKIHKASSILKKLIWIVLVLAMVSWLCVQCFWLFQKYFAYPVDVKIEMVSVPKLEFPSVTVCNSNPLKMSKVRGSPFEEVWHYFEIHEDDSLYEKAIGMFKTEENIEDYDADHSDTEWFDSMVTVNDTSGTSGSSNDSKSVMTMLEERDFNMWDALEDEDMAKQFYDGSSEECEAMFGYGSVASKMTEQELKKYGHNKKDLIMSCRWNGKPCSPKNFTYVHNVKYGNCYTFNSYKSDTPVLTTNYPGPLMGLVIEFNIEQKEYIPILAPEAGVRVMIHERGSYPFLEDDGFLIAPGYLTSVGIEKTRISRLPPPHAKCANSAPGKDLYMEQYKVDYGKRSCLKSCYQNKFIAECGCAVPWYKIQKDAILCDYLNETVGKCLYETVEKLEDCDEVCPSPCLEYRYGETLSMAKWPSDKYEHYLNSRIKKTHVDFMNERTMGDTSKNLAKLEVFYRDLIYQDIDSQKGYESQNLISDIGGQLGLWLGLSAITLGELMEFFAAVGKAMTASAVKKKHGAPTNTPVQKF